MNDFFQTQVEADFSSLKKRIRHIIKTNNCTNGSFATAVRMNLQRVQNIASGRVQTLKPEECVAIRDIYGINADWLITGKGKRDLPKSERKRRSANSDAARRLTHHLSQAVLCLQEMLDATGVTA